MNKGKMGIKGKGKNDDDDDDMKLRHVFDMNSGQS